MSGQNTIELAFSRPRFAVLVGTAVITAVGLLAAGLFAGIQVGTLQAMARFQQPAAAVEVPRPLPESQLPISRPALPAELLPEISAPPAPEQLEQYVIQAASFHEHSQAESLTADLARGGYPAKALEVKDPAGRGWSIVRVGPYRERSEASQVAGEIGRMARTAPIVRVDDGTVAGTAAGTF
jgi:cell division protein FtsN